MDRESQIFLRKFPPICGGELGVQKAKPKFKINFPGKGNIFGGSTMGLARRKRGPREEFFKQGQGGLERGEKKLFEKGQAGEMFFFRTSGEPGKEF